MPQTYSCVPRPYILREDAAVNLSAAFMITTLASAINEIASEMPLLRTLLGVMGERKCADTNGTVPVPWAGHFQCYNKIHF